MSAAANDATQSGPAPTVSKPDNSAPERHARLVKLLRKGLQRFVNDVARVLTSEDKRAIHDLRVWSRRLQQVLVAMYGDELPRRARAVRRVLRRTRRAIGAWRNYDVVTEAIERRVSRARSERRSAWEIVLKSVSEARRREIRRARKRLMKLNIFGLREAAESLIESGGAEAGSLDASFWTSVAEAHDRWREAYAGSVKSKRAEDIHAFRIRSKRLRYRIELARELGAEETGSLLEWFKKLQDGLGRWRDRVELSRVIARSIADPERLLNEPRASILLLNELERLNRRAEHEIDALLGGIEGSAGFKQCEGWVRDHTRIQAEPEPAAASSSGVLESAPASTAPRV
jgi:CHAD domain-containing protein